MLWLELSQLAKHGKLTTFLMQPSYFAISLINIGYVYLVDETQEWRSRWIVLRAFNL